MQTAPSADPLRTVIQANPHFAGRNVTVENADGRVVLTGSVGSYFQKQMAQEALRRVDGVHDIDNRLEVFVRV